MRPLPLALLLLLTAATAHAAPSTPLAPLQRGPEAQALRQIEATRPLPGASFSAVKVTGRQDLYFLSGDGRILIKGTAYDLWSGQTLSTIEDVAEATTRINLDGFAAIWPQLDPIKLGQGPNTVVAFVAPGCPHCQSLIEQARALGERYRFLLLPIPAGGQGGAIIRALACAADKPAATTAFLRHESLAGIAQAPGCNVEAAQRRLITAQLLGVKAVPWIVRSDGTLSSGMPPDLAAWLAAGSPS